MRIRNLAALIAAAVLVAGTTLGADIAGKWSTDPQRKQPGGIGSVLATILGGNSGPIPGAPGPRGNPGPWSPRGPVIDGPRGGDNVFNRPRVLGTDAVILGPEPGSYEFGNTTTLTADFKVDTRKGMLRGSLTFRKPDSYRIFQRYPIRPEVCGELAVEEGILTDDTFTFTTYARIRGVRVPTQWKGRIAAGNRMFLEPQEALPCSEQLSGRQGLGRDSATLTFHRAKEGDGFQGKWWTRDPGAMGVLELTTSPGVGTVTGEFENVCGEERKLTGTFSGARFSMTTPANATGFGPTEWKGVLLDKDTLQVTAGPPPQCVIERPSPFVLSAL
jgi:hypothetical protein